MGEERAQAKINLSLRVLGKRPDGYHELMGLMARVGLHDEVSLSLAGPGGEDVLAFEDRIGEPFGGTLAGDGEFAGPRNLALRAVRAFREETGRPGGPVRVSLVKGIPLGSGLGGSSSDAAAVLRILGRKWPVGGERLGRLALGLGADVPFFLGAGPFCWAGGVGERLRPYHGPMPGGYAALVNPGIKLSTAKVFAQLGLTSGLKGSISLIAESVQGDGQPFWGVNDLEGAAVSLCPALSMVREAIAKADPAPVRMGLSGSGATYWAVYGRLGEARAAAGSLAGQGFWVRVVTLGP